MEALGEMLARAGGYTYTSEADFWDATEPPKEARRAD